MLHDARPGCCVPRTRGRASCGALCMTRLRPIYPEPAGSAAPVPARCGAGSPGLVSASVSGAVPARRATLFRGPGRRGGAPQARAPAQRPQEQSRRARVAACGACGGEDLDPPRAAELLGSWGTLAARVADGREPDGATAVRRARVAGPGARSRGAPWSGRRRGRRRGEGIVGGAARWRVGVVCGGRWAVKRCRRPSSAGLVPGPDPPLDSLRMCPRLDCFGRGDGGVGCRGEVAAVCGAGGDETAARPATRDCRRLGKQRLTWLGWTARLTLAAEGFSQTSGSGPLCADLPKGLAGHGGL